MAIVHRSELDITREAVVELAHTVGKLTNALSKLQLAFMRAQILLMREGGISSEAAAEIAKIDELSEASNTGTLAAYESVLQILTKLGEVDG